MGNVLSLALGTSRTATLTYSGTLPKLSQVTETGPGTRSVVYDAAANETMVGTSAFTYSPRNNLAAADGLTYTYDGRGLRTIVRDGSGNLRYFFYSPEMNLLAETTFGANPQAAGGYEYIWFNGQPVAEKDGGIHWTFTDHLGTPLIQTDSGGTVFWRAEYEPYGRVFALRTADQHQPLRLPGQEAEQLNLGANGVTERFYNIFRWYRPNWGRYTQADPIGILGGANLFRYAVDNPERVYDPLGQGPCAKNPSFAACQERGTGCCVAKCIDDLRYSLCERRRLEPGLKWAGAGAGALTGAAVGAEFGLLPGACIGAVAGGLIGYYGVYYGYEAVIATAGQMTLFRKCMESDCGVLCKPGGPCLTNNLFHQIAAERR